MENIPESFIKKLDLCLKSKTLPTEFILGTGLQSR